MMDSSLSSSNMDSSARLMKSVLCNIRYKYAFLRWSEPDLSLSEMISILGQMVLLQSIFLSQDLKLKLSKSSAGFKGTGKENRGRKVLLLFLSVDPWAVWKISDEDFCSDEGG